MDAGVSSVSAWDVKAGFNGEVSFQRLSINGVLL